MAHPGSPIKSVLRVMPWEVWGHGGVNPYFPEPQLHPKAEHEFPWQSGAHTHGGFLIACIPLGVRLHGRKGFNFCPCSFSLF